MKRILVTGSTGFIGKNVIPILAKNPNNSIVTLNREELDLKNECTLKSFLSCEKFDVILHLANPSPGKNIIDSKEKLVEDSLRIFMNLFNHRDLYKKMIYVGSGAEYDKTINLDLIEETECFRSVPKDAYGLSKMIMNRLAEFSENIYNFRVLGCFGPNDHESKFITHCIRSVILGVPITIRKDCKFDYLHVYDLARYLNWGIENDLQYHNYNISSGNDISLLDIANTVVNCMSFPSEWTLQRSFEPVEIQLLSRENNTNYTASPARVVFESNIKPLISLEDGIKKQIKWEIQNWNDNTLFDGK